MTKAAHAVLNEALALTPLERSSLIERLITSFSPDSRAEIDRQWAREAESRIDAYDQGHMKARSLQTIVKRVNRR